MKVVYARADKVPEDCDYITAGKLYPVQEMNFYFRFTCDDGSQTTSEWRGRAGILWTRIEYPYRDPEAVEALIAAARKILAELHAINICLVDPVAKKAFASIINDQTDALARLEGGEAALGGE